MQNQISQPAQIIFVPDKTICVPDKTIFVPAKIICTPIKIIFVRISEGKTSRERGTNDLVGILREKRHLHGVPNDLLDV